MVVDKGLGPLNLLFDGLRQLLLFRAKHYSEQLQRHTGNKRLQPGRVMLDAIQDVFKKRSKLMVHSRMIEGFISRDALFFNPILEDAAPQPNPIFAPSVMR